MIGPMPRENWSAAMTPSRGHLHAGTKYRVVQSFVDFDGGEHPVGETWWFLGADYNAYHDGLSLFVSLDGDRLWQIRLSAFPGDQDRIVAELDAYIAVDGS